MTPLEKVRAELRRYVHPLMNFDARQLDDGDIVLVIDLKNPPPGVHVYEAPLHPRDLESSQFPWTFQRLLYDCLHDYVVELFTSTPQRRDVEP